MAETVMNSFSIGGGLIVCAALIAGLLGARYMYRRPEKIGAREFAVFSYCYVIWLVMGPMGLGWRYPRITVWFLVTSSAIYLPVLIALALRWRSGKSAGH